MKTQRELKAKIKLAAERMANIERREWPPGCYGFIYQPMRPMNKETNVSKTERVNILGRQKYYCCCNVSHPTENTWNSATLLN